MATLLSNQPVPGGRRVAIVTNGGGPGIIAADACEQHGLVLPELSPEVIEQLKPLVKRDIAFRNPLDLTAGATGEEFEGVLKILADDNSFDAVLTIFIPPTIVDSERGRGGHTAGSPPVPATEEAPVGLLYGATGLQDQAGDQRQICPLLSFPRRGRLGFGQGR